MHSYNSLKGKGLVLLAFLWLLWFINFTCRTILSPVLPLIEDEFVVSHAWASSIFMFASGGYALSLFFSGFFAALLGPRKAIITGLGLSALMLFVVTTIKTFSLLYACFFVLGGATGLYLPNIIPLITDYYDEKIWGKTISIHDSATSVSFLASPFIALFILQFFPWRGIFLVLAAAFLVGALVFAFVIREVKTQERKSYFMGHLLKEKALWWMAIVWIFSAAANFGLYLIIPLYLTKELGMEMGRANTMFGLSRIGGIVVSVSAGFFVDRFSVRKAIFFLVSISGLLTTALAAGYRPAMETLLFLQASISIGFFPVSLVAISRMFGRDERGQATGFIVTLASVIGIGVIPYLLGLSGDLVSFRVGILFLGLCTLLSSAAVFFMKGLK